MVTYENGIGQYRWLILVPSLIKASSSKQAKTLSNASYNENVKTYRQQVYIVPTTTTFKQAGYLYPDNWRWWNMKQLVRCPYFLKSSTNPAFQMNMYENGAGDQICKIPSSALRKEKKNQTNNWKGERECHFEGLNRAIRFFFKRTLKSYF